MPRAVQYKAGSIVFFSGDFSKHIYVLKQGQISLTYKDIHDGQEIVEYVKQGEFFGVKATLGRYPHDETATVMTNAVVIQFSISEFEQYMQQNPQLIIKMLGVYSKHLRVIHNDVQNLLSNYKVLFPEEGLVKVGEYYLKNKNYKHALYAFNKYKFHFPEGAYKDLVSEKISSIPHDYDKDYKKEDLSVDLNKTTKSAPHSGLGKPDQKYSEALNFLTQKTYDKALNGFLSVIKAGHSDHLAQAELKIGICLFFLGKYNETIQHFSSLLKKYPKHPDIGEILFYIGQSYEKLGVSDKALAFYKKSEGLVDSSISLYSQIQRALSHLQRGGV